MQACHTQWRTGFGGATGLDYNAVFAVAGALGITMDAQTLRGIACLEGCTLDMWQAQQGKNNNS